MIINTEKKGSDIWLSLKGTADSSNMQELEKALKDAREMAAGGKLYVDLAELTYISSAGLRVFLETAGTGVGLSLINVSNAVYEVFQITGLVQLLDIQKAERAVSLKDAVFISRGAIGMVFRISKDEIIKVFTDGSSKEEIQPSVDRVKAVLLAGVPSPITYDVVKVTDYTEAITKAEQIPGAPAHKLNLPPEGEGNVYGVIFELMDGDTLASVMSKEPERVEEYSLAYIELLKKMHSCRINDPVVPTVKEIYRQRIDALAPYITEKETEILRAFLDSLPDGDRCLHNDPHLLNVMVSHGRMMLIDLDDSAAGHPVFDLVCHLNDYNAYMGQEKQHPGWLMEHMGMDEEKLNWLWSRILESYTGTKDKEKLDRLVAFLGVFAGVRVLSTLGGDSIPEDYRKEMLTQMRQYLFPVLPDMIGSFYWPEELD